MKSIISSLKLKAFLFVALTCALFAGCKREGLAPGLYPPHFEFERLSDGKKVSLKDYEGNLVLLNFWATWCPPCIAEMPSLERLYQENKDKGLVVIGVATQDSKNDVKDFIDSSNITFPILLDPTGELTRKLEIGGFPETFLFDKQGRFKLITDPKTGELVFRVIGERDWSKARIG